MANLAEQGNPTTEVICETNKSINFQIDKSAQIENHLHYW